MKAGRLKAVVFLFFCLSVPTQAFAFPKVYSPIVEKGEIELEYQASANFDDRAGFENGQVHRFAIGYGVNDRWYTEVYAELEREATEENDEGEKEHHPFDYTATAWENRLQLTEQGQFWLDLGLYTEYEWASRHRGVDHLELKILFEKEWDDWRHRLNVIFEKEVGGGETESLEPGFAWQTLYRLREEVQPGIELHSNFGPVDDRPTYQEQKHSLGPVLEGRIYKKIRYNVGYLFGLTDSTPDGQLKWTMEWEERF